MPHRPYQKIVPGSSVAVLMVHGILGSPHHFDMLMPYIPSDWSVYNIVLDGHGATARDFARTSRKKWEAQIERVMADVCAAHAHVVVVAHSMGCMLTMNAAVKLGLERQISAMFFLGAALYPMCTPSIVKTAFYMLFGKPDSGDNRAKAARLRCGTVIHRRLWEYFAWIPRFIELFALAWYTRRRVPKYDLPIIALQSWQDEVVGRRSIKPFRKNPRAKSEFLMESSHFYYAPQDEKRICLVFNKTLANVIKNLQKSSVAIDKAKTF